MNIIRVLMCAALVAAPLEIADAQCYVDANGNTVCPARSTARGPVRRWVQSTRPARTYTRVYSRTYSQPVQSSGSSANYGAGSSGYSSTYTTAPVVTYTSEPAEADTPAAKAGSAGCDCGCAEELEAIRERLDALESRPYYKLPGSQASKAGPAFSFTKQEGPAFAFTKPEGVAVASR